MNFWSVKNVQKYYNCINPSLSTVKIFSYHAALEVLRVTTLKSQYRPTRKVFVYKIQVNPIHTILKYGNYYDFMDR